MKKFITVRYETESRKLKSQSFSIAMISDLHNVVFGKNNEGLIEALKKERPDLICIAGDLVLGKKGASLKEPYQFLKETVKIAPVFYSYGNHEQRMKLFPAYYGREYLMYEKKLLRLGVRLLDNASEKIEIRGEKVAVTGLTLPYGYYKKGVRQELKKRELDRLLGKEDREAFQVLLAHTPKYAEAYFAWGGDLIFSGHYHGGMARLPFLGGVVSPDFRLFPKYCRGKFQKGGKTLITGAGLGEHTIPFRLWNPRELVMVTCGPEKKI